MTDEATTLVPVAVGGHGRPRALPADRLVGFTLKHNLDRLVATLVFGRPGGVFNYWIPPTKAVRLTGLSRDDAVFLATMLVLALPFIWVGVVLTVRRLRAATLPVWLVALFFLPVLNLLFFLLLSLVPSRPAPGAALSAPGRPLQRLLSRLIPEGTLGSTAMASVLTFPFGVAGTWLGAKVFVTYGWTLFVALPFCLGLAAALLHGYHRPRAACWFAGSRSCSPRWA